MQLLQRVLFATKQSKATPAGSNLHSDELPKLNSNPIELRGCEKKLDYIEQIIYYNVIFTVTRILLMYLLVHSTNQSVKL